MGATTTLYVTDADNREALEYDGTFGAPQRWYAFGQGPDDVLNQMNVAAGTRETMIPDIQGSIIGMLDSGGSDAAAAVAALYISQDLLKGGESAKPLTVAWIVNRWLTDQRYGDSLPNRRAGTDRSGVAYPRGKG